MLPCGHSAAQDSRGLESQASSWLKYGFGRGISHSPAPRPPSTTGLRRSKPGLPAPLCTSLSSLTAPIRPTRPARLQAGPLLHPCYAAILFCHCCHGGSRQLCPNISWSQFKHFTRQVCSIQSPLAKYLSVNKAV